MKLSQLASKPQLVKVVLNDEATIKEHGEQIEFWMYDRQDMDTFMKLAQLNDNNVADISEVVERLVLDENGNSVLADGKLLPMNLMMKVIEAAVSNLGNALNQTTAK